MITLDVLIKAVSQANVVAFGEEHYHPAIQAFALQLLQALAQRRPQRLALAMEFLERHQQQTVDDYLRGAIDRVTFETRLGASPAFMRHYFPLVDYAREQGLPVIAMNTPRHIARQVARQGLQETLRQLSGSDRAYLPETLSAVTPSYRTYFLETVAAHHPLRGEQAEHFVEASHLKDETMAASLARFLDQHRGFTVLAIAGRFHFDYGKAIPPLLRQHHQRLVMSHITALAVGDNDTVNLQRLAREQIADYLWFAAPAPAQRDRLTGQLVARHRLRQARESRAGQILQAPLPSVPEAGRGGG
jgi:uncharacterized iron-regulated protein